MATLTLTARHGSDAPLFVGRDRVVPLSSVVADARELARDARMDFVVATTDREVIGIATLAAMLASRAVVFPPSVEDAVVGAIVAAHPGARVLHAGERTDGIDPRGRGASASIPDSFDIDADATLGVFHTSGTTGAPEPHAKTAAELLLEARMHVERLGLDASTAIVATVPSTHLYGFLFGFLVPLLAGARVSLDAPGTPDAIASRGAALAADVLVSVPPHLRALEALFPEASRFSPRLVVSSGARLDDGTARALASRFSADVEEVLGSTETGGLGVRRAGDVGFSPLPGVRFVDAVDGRLLVASEYVRGSTTEPRLTEDRGTLAEGRFVHGGRADDVVKIGGTRVSTADVEAHLRAIDGVSDAHVRAISGTELHERRLFAIVASDSLDAKAVRAALAATLPAIAVPKKIVVVREIPRGAAGKVDAASIEALLRTRATVSLERTDAGVDVSVPLDSRAFDGHFPGRPILPGVVQLRDVVLASVRREWPELAHPTRLTRVKFKRPVGPGERLFLGLSRPTETRVQFSLSSGDHEVATGLFHFESPSR